MYFLFALFKLITLLLFNILLQGISYHYIISRHLDGTVAIQDGTKFESPVELVRHHIKYVDGLLTMLKYPCSRNPSQPAQGYRFITNEEMQKTMKEVALLLGYQVCV